MCSGTLLDKNSPKFYLSISATETRRLHSHSSEAGKKDFNRSMGILEMEDVQMKKRDQCKDKIEGYALTAATSCPYIWSLGT
jgi:hypothetical protein